MQSERHHRMHSPTAHSERRIPDEVITIVRLKMRAVECICGLMSELPKTWEFVPDIIIEVP